MEQETGLSPPPQHSWYAVRTRSNYEKITANLLEAKGFEQYLPLYQVRKLWSDRVMESSLPLFPGYVFCKFDARCRTPILSTHGVVSIVSFAGQPALIADEEIKAVQAVLRSERLTEPCPYLCEGQLIRINRGPLAGLEGILVKKRNWRIVISIQILRRSVSVEVDPDSITPI
ncbi:MAG: UpxY family transcription antiterminator [Pyrinomonadaceae bacterium]